MGSLRKSLLHDERGVEPTVMKILVGIILVGIGLGIGVTVYNRFGGTVTSYLDYSVAVTPDSDTIAVDESESFSVDVQTSVDFDEEVDLVATGVPSNVNVEFSPNSGVPTFGSTMTIEVLSGASTGTHTITIRAETDDGEKTATFELTIE